MTEPFLIGIGGGTGAGKTTIAKEISERIGDGVKIIPTDNYYQELSHLSFEERKEVNYDHPESFDWELMVEQLEDLRSGETVQMPQYDYTIHNREEERVEFEPADVIIVEGILALHREDLRDMYDLKLYVETDDDIRIIRRIRRDMEERDRDFDFVIDQYLSMSKPMHEQYVRPTKKEADLIIPEGMNHNAVDLLLEKVMSEIDN